MIIPGYLDGYEPPFLRSPLVDGSDIMSQELFWPAFLAIVGGSTSVPDAFGVDPADLEHTVDTFPFAWPEVVAAARQPDQDHTPAERLLLLVPACADSNRPGEAVDLVAEALTALGARSDVRQVSEELRAGTRTLVASVSPSLSDLPKAIRQEHNCCRRVGGRDG
ncbi:hypothetical protein [Micromonospora taraxaci]